MLGTLSVMRGGALQPLPGSRKARALLAYLALASSPVPRRELCDLLWDSPSDPRGELRWCLSRMRKVLDDEHRCRVVARVDSVHLDLTDSHVDAADVLRASQQRVQLLDLDGARNLLSQIGGVFLEGLEIERCPTFNSWLTLQRRRCRTTHALLLERLSETARGDDAIEYLERWLQLEPFDERVHSLLLKALVARRRLRDAEAHLQAATALFRSEGIDNAGLREAWRSALACIPGVSAVEMPTAASISPAGGGGEVVRWETRRASVAVLSLRNMRSKAAHVVRVPEELLTHEVVTHLTRLRSLWVLTPARAFVTEEHRTAVETARRRLDADYVLHGFVHGCEEQLTVSVELLERRTGRAVWAGTFHNAHLDMCTALDEIGGRIAAGVAGEIEAIERSCALRQPVASLDAWEAYHRALWHVYRFNEGDNEQARHFFGQALRLDPAFARAHAGLSFVYFQNAFQGWAEPEFQIDHALDCAGKSIIEDGRDPASHCALARALWLRGDLDQCVVELKQALELSPHFSLGHYTLAFVQSQAGDPHAAIASSDYSRELSPADPLLFGMLGARAMALVRLGQFEEAADWAARAASRPNAHPHIFAIAACSSALAGKAVDAQSHAAAIRKREPTYNFSAFRSAFRFDTEGESRFAAGARLAGIA